MFAWTIIFAHSIVPHNHHDIQIECNHSHVHSHDQIGVEEFQCCDHDSKEHTCHFHVEIFTQVSIDNIFIPNNENSLFADSISVETNSYIYYKEFVSEQVFKTNYLRGPPQLV
jgi:hypothetical protein